MLTSLSSDGPGQPRRRLRANAPAAQTIEREMTDMQIQRTAIQFLLENSKAIFADP